MTTTLDPAERHLADRAGVLANQRAAHTARIDASAFEAIAAHVQSNPAYGRRAERAAKIVREGYIAMVMGLLDIADEAQAEADDFRIHLGVA